MRASPCEGGPARDEREKKRAGSATCAVAAPGPSGLAPTPGELLVEDSAKLRDLPVLDATCPLVAKVHKEGQRYAEKGYEVILIGHEGIARSNPDRIAIDLMNDALGGSGFSSRLMKVVRAKNGLTYSIGSGFGLRSQPGPFQIQTFTKVESVRAVVDLVLEEMGAIREARPVDAEELAKFKSYSAGAFGLSLETSGAVLSSLVDLEVHGLPEDSLDTFRARVGETTLEQVRAAAKDRLHPERAAIVVLGPAEKLVPQLESLGPVEVVKP